MKTTTLGCLLLAAAWANATLADDTAPPPPPKGDFMSSLKQSFRHDYDHEVVRGHFDIGTAPDTHRYYCLIDPKTGKLESNGIAGTPTKRPDGMTGIQGAAVSFYSCTDAESKGLLVSSGYQLPAVTPRAAPVPAKSAAPAGAGATSVAPLADDPSSKFNTSDPLFTLQSFIEVYNSGNATALASVLAESADFAWVQPDGRTLWGHRAAEESLQASRIAGSLLQFQSQEGHTISLASKTAILISKLRMTVNGQDARIIRCSSVIVPTSKGWRIVSLFMTPESD